jgi:hypothetical protein
MNNLFIQTDESKGNIALLREIVQAQEAQLIAGLNMEPEMAERMLHLYDVLPPHLQELIAMECNTDFRSWATRFAAFDTMKGQGSILVLI